VVGQGVLDGAAAALRRGEAAAPDRGRQDQRDGLQALEAQDLLDQVGRDGQVAAPCRRGDLEVLAGGDDRAADLLEAGDDGLAAVVDAGEFRGVRGVHGDGRHRGDVTDDGALGGDRTTGDVDEQRAGHVEGDLDDGRVDAALEASGGLRFELVAARGARDGQRVPGGGLEVDVGGVVGDLGAGAAHDTGQG